MVQLNKLNDRAIHARSVRLVGNELYMDYSIRKIEENERENALDLVWNVFREYEAPDYSDEGVGEFYKSIHDENYLSKLCLYGAFISETLIGVIATRSEGTHIALFFVDGRHQGKGIGKALFQTAAADSKFITLRSPDLSQTGLYRHRYRTIGEWSEIYSYGVYF